MQFLDMYDLQNRDELKTKKDLQFMWFISRYVTRPPYIRPTTPVPYKGAYEQVKQEKSKNKKLIYRSKYIQIMN